MSDSSNKGDPSTSDGIEMIQKPSAIPVVENSTNDSDPNCIICSLYFYSSGQSGRHKP